VSLLGGPATTGAMEQAAATSNDKRENMFDSSKRDDYRIEIDKMEDEEIGAGHEYIMHHVGGGGTERHVSQSRELALGVAKLHIQQSLLGNSVTSPMAWMSVGNLEKLSKCGRFWTPILKLSCIQPLPNMAFHSSCKFRYDKRRCQVKPSKVKEGFFRETRLLPLGACMVMVDMVMNRLLCLHEVVTVVLNLLFLVINALELNGSHDAT
jgi:hypothetical protein